MIDRIKKGKFILGAMVIAVLAIIIPVTINQVQKNQETRSRASGEAVSVLLTPLATNVTAGNQLDIQVTINGGQNNISAVDITFTYDVGLLSGEGLSPGEVPPPILPSLFETATTFTTIINDQQTPGSIHFVGVNPTANAITGSSINLGTLHFFAGGSGTATVGFSNIHINASGVASALPIDTNNTKNGTYTIMNSATPTPTVANICGNGICEYGEPRCPVHPTCEPGEICSQYAPCEPNYYAGTCPQDCQQISPTPTSTSTPTPTTAPTAIPTTEPNTTSLKLSLKLVGIGNSTSSAGLNNNPKRPERNVQVKLINARGQEIPLQQATVIFDASTGLYKGTVRPANPFVTGSYIIKVRMDNALWKQVPGIQNITAGTIYEAPLLTLVTGDIDQDNEINLLDYNSLLPCYGGTACETEILADLNDDGKIDEIDLNILYSGFSKRTGD